MRIESWGGQEGEPLWLLLIDDLDGGGLVLKSFFFAEFAAVGGDELLHGLGVEFAVFEEVPLGDESADGLFFHREGRVYLAHLVEAFEGEDQVGHRRTVGKLAACLGLVGEALLGDGDEHVVVLVGDEELAGGAEQFAAFALDVGGSFTVNHQLAIFADGHFLTLG